MKIMVRFKGGCGGATYSWFLDELLNKTSVQKQTIFNRREHYDVFHFFAFSTFPQWLFPDQNKRLWDELPVELIKNRLDEYLINYSKNYLIGKSHPYIMDKEKWPIIFPDWYMIDISPTLGKFWITQFLQFYKSAFVKYTNSIDDLGPRVNDHPQYKRIKKFFKHHGWIPEYWIWIITSPETKSLDDIEGFFERHTIRSMERLVDYQTCPCNLFVEGSNLVVDTKLTEFYKIADILNTSIDNQLTNKLLLWVNENREILKKFNLLDKVDDGTEMDPEETHRFLRDLFWDKAVRMAAGDDS